MSVVVVVVCAEASSVSFPSNSSANTTLVHACLRTRLTPFVNDYIYMRDQVVLPCAKCRPHLLNEACLTY